MDNHFRLARPEDSDSILAIYAPYVRDTVTSFELEPPTSAEYRARVETIGSVYPFLVHETKGGIDGFAYASRQFERRGYDYNVFTSVYLAPDAQGRGVGKALYERLFAILGEQGYCNAYAIITLPNERSVGLHRGFGFEDLGIHRRTGYKFGRWCDVIWMGKDLGALDDPPCCVPVTAIPEDVMETILTRGSAAEPKPAQIKKD